MDALEVCEKNNVSYKSQKEGLMHACGHDGHMAMLLGAAHVLNEIKNDISGEIKLLFQPAEETAKGAKAIIEESKIIDSIDTAFAIHLWQGVPVGKISLESGARMAAAALFSIKVKGKSGQMGSHQVKKLLHSKGNNQQSEETTHRMGENICKLPI